MANRRGMRLQHRLSQTSGRTKGLLLANSNAHRVVYGTDLIMRSERNGLLQSMVSAEEARGCVRILFAAELLHSHISDTKVRYLRLREQFAHLGGLFGVFRTELCYKKVLNELWSETHGKRALPERSGGSRRVGPCAAIGARDKGASSFTDIAVSEREEEIARQWISSATELMVSLKTMIEAGREFMEANHVHLTAYEDQLSGWEEELRELIPFTKCRLLPIDSEGRVEPKDLYAQSSDGRLELVEALPEYDAVAIDDASCDEMVAELEDCWNLWEIWLSARVPAIKKAGRKIRGLNQTG